MTRIEELEQILNETAEKFNKEIDKFKAEIEHIKALAELKESKKESKKEGKWKPAVGEEYYYRDSDGDDVCIYWYNDDANHWRVNNLPVFKTKEQCKRYWHFMDTVKEKSYEFSKEEWEEWGIFKYAIVYEHDGKKLKILSEQNHKYLGKIYFKTKEDAQYIIDNFKDELMDYWI